MKLHPVNIHSQRSAKNVFSEYADLGPVLSFIVAMEKFPASAREIYSDI